VNRLYFNNFIVSNAIILPTTRHIFTTTGKPEMVEQAPGICVVGVVVAENEFRRGVPAVHDDSIDYMSESIHNHVKACVVFLILEDHLHQSATIIHPRARPYSTTGVKRSLNPHNHTKS